jgi:hypothetical protein
MVEWFIGTWLLEVENPREKPPEDLLEAAASWVSLCHRRTTSLAIGRRWYEETRAAEDTEGFLSTIAVFITRSIDWTVVAFTVSASRGVGVPASKATYIDNAAEGANSIWSVDSIGAAAGILHNRAGNHNNILS